MGKKSLFLVGVTEKFYLKEQNFKKNERF